MRSILLSFRPDISLEEVPPGQVVVRIPSGGATLNDVTPGVLAVLRILASGGATDDDLGEIVCDHEGLSGLSPFYYRLSQWAKRRWLCWSALAGDEVLATVVPMTEGLQPPEKLVDADARHRLSRFAFCRRDGDVVVLESPLSPVAVLLAGSTGAGLVGELARPRSARELCTPRKDLDEEAARTFLTLLSETALVGEVGDDGTLPEDEAGALRSWDFHDLLFHSRSRRGGHDHPLGATHRFAGVEAPLPAVKPEMPGHLIALFKPDLARLAREDRPLTDVLERRRSVRRYGVRPMTVEQLGEFLYRVARVRLIVEPHAAHGSTYETTSRPYPSGGAAYDLEIYLTVGACAGLDRGIYHYDPLHHGVRRLDADQAGVDALLRDAQFAAALADEPPMVLTMTSRFQRLSWKYSGLAYALALKNVGVLVQTMYLVATAMKLAPCAVGTGDSDLFRAATGTDPLVEPAVGELILGSSPAD